MWQRRDEIARSRDVTATRILPDSAIVAAAAAAPTSRNALARVEGYATRGGQRYLRDFAQVKANGHITKAVAEQALQLLDVDQSPVQRVELVARGKRTDEPDGEHRPVLHYVGGQQVDPATDDPLAPLAQQPRNSQFGPDGR